MSEWVWSGTATVRPGLMVVSGEIGTATAHSHHSVQIMLARRGEFVLADGHGARQRSRAVVVPPDRTHAVIEGAADGLLIHIDPESHAARRLTHMIEIPDSVREWCRVGAAVVADPEWFQEEHFRMSAATSPAPRRHPAVTRAVLLLRERLADGPVRLADLAAAVDLSESRLAHLFSSELGLPLRPYVRWLRLQHAIDLIARGHTLTDAAHAAGFTDSSHLNRVCHNTFGAAPSNFRRFHWVEDLIP